MSSGKTDIASKVSKDFTFIAASPSQEGLQEILRIEARKAISLGQKPYVLFTADWCPPCMALRESLDEPLMRDAFRNTYIIEIDTVALGHEDQKIVEKRFNAKGIPSLYELNVNGEPAGHKISGNNWDADIPANMAPPLKAFFGN
jgi:thiol-disulfide isomerase/thioredoxin